MLTSQVSATRLYSARTVVTNAIAKGKQPLPQTGEWSSKHEMHCTLWTYRRRVLQQSLLVDVYSQCSPQLTKCVYAIVDEQSNSSLVTSELADDLGAGGPLEKYFLSTCSGERGEIWPASSGHHSTGYQWSRVCLAYPHRVRYHPTGQTWQTTSPVSPTSTTPF